MSDWWAKPSCGLKDRGHCLLLESLRRVPLSQQKATGQPIAAAEWHQAVWRLRRFGELNSAVDPVNKSDDQVGGATLKRMRERNTRGILIITFSHRPPQLRSKGIYVFHKGSSPFKIFIIQMVMTLLIYDKILRINLELNKLYYSYNQYCKKN